MTYLSLIVPVYNERARLVRGVRRIMSYLRKQPYPWECILVDDGSTKPVRTLPIISKLSFEMGGRFFVIRLAKNQGKGAAIAAGVQRAKGKYIVFTDIDLSVSIRSLKRVLDVLDNGSCRAHFNSRNRSNMLFKIPGIERSCDIVIASRRHTKSRIVVHQPFVREFSGRIFTFLSNTICNAGVTDATCGFKGFRKDVAKQLFQKSKIKRWVFDTEILFLARKSGYSIRELPVSWSNVSGSRVRAGDSFASLIDLFKIRMYDAKGIYD